MIFSYKITLLITIPIKMVMTGRSNKSLLPTIAHSNKRNAGSMADPYLSSDESVILATDKVLFRLMPVSALVLTNKRILLIQADGDNISADEIQLARLRKARALQQASREPVLELSVITGTGNLRQETLTFLEAEGTSRIAECREWAEKLTAQVVPPVTGDAAATGIPAPEKQVANAGQEEPAAAKPVPPRPMDRGATQPATPAASSSDGGILARHSRPSGLAFPKIPRLSDSDLAEASAASKPRSLKGVAILILIVIAILVAAIAFTFITAGKTAGPAPAAATPVPTPAMTTLQPTPVPTQPVPVMTTGSEVSGVTTAGTPAVPAEITAPATGIWVVVRYPGSFNGTVGVDGALKDISGSGSGLYQLVMRSGVAKAYVQKTDGTTSPLSVSIYNNGNVIGSDTTMSPVGEVNIQVLIKPPQTTPEPDTTTAASITEPTTAKNP
jgi:hypothetical protein